MDGRGITWAAIAIRALDRDEHAAAMLAPAQHVDRSVKQRREQRERGQQLHSPQPCQGERAKKKRGPLYGTDLFMTPASALNPTHPQ